MIFATLYTASTQFEITFPLFLTFVLVKIEALLDSICYNRKSANGFLTLSEFLSVDSQKNCTVFII